MADSGAHRGQEWRGAGAPGDLPQHGVVKAALDAAAFPVDAPLWRQRRTLLHVAVLGLRPDLVELALEHGADPLAEDATGRSPYALAAELSTAARTGGVRASPLATRLDTVLGLLQYPVALQSFWDEDMAPPLALCAGAADAAPAAPGLFRLTSGDRQEPPPPPERPSLDRTVTVEGVASARASAALCGAARALHERLSRGEQAFSDIGLRCVLSLQEEDGGAAGCKLQCDVADPSRCGICLEAVAGALLTAPCGSVGCRAAFCADCLTAHVRHSTGELRYALPVVKCPAPECLRRIPGKVWVPLLTAAGEEAVEERIVQAGRALLKIRCPACHTPRDLSVLDGRAAQGVASAAEEVLDGLTTEERLRVARAAVGFRHGVSAEVVIDALSGVGPGKADAAAEDGEPESGAARLPRKAPWWLTPRFRALCRLLNDAERVTALQLAFFRRYPLIETPCCHVSMCFKCKVHGHHPGQSCEERQAAEISIDAQYCPKCGVPTVKSEGCSSIICVCGAAWSWRAK